MKLSYNFLKSVLLAVVFATVVSAAPFTGSLKHTSTQKRSIGNLVVESFHPESSFEVSKVFNPVDTTIYSHFLISQTFGVEGIAHPLSARDEFVVKDATVSFVQSRLNVHPDTVGFRTSFENDVAHHAFVKQQVVRDIRLILVPLD